MATALEQLRYVDDQLVQLALTPEHAELVRVHRLMWLQLRSARLQELPQQPPEHTPEYEQWERCKKDIEQEVDLNLAETRLSVEGLENAWENWLHLEKLKAIREQLLQQTSSDGLMPGFQQVAAQGQVMNNSHGQDHVQHEVLHEQHSQAEIDAWQNMHNQVLEAQQWAGNQEHQQAHLAEQTQLAEQAMLDQQNHLRGLEQMRRQHEDQQAQLREHSASDQHHAHQLQPPEAAQTGANVGHENYSGAQLLQQQQQWQQMAQEQQEREAGGAGQHTGMPQTVQMKLCRRCNTHKPVTQFYKSKANADGYDGRCKTCDAVQCAQRRRRKERVENPTVDWKVCRRCGMNKPAAEFYRNKTNGDGLYNNCKICFSHDAATRRERLPPLEERTAISKECRRCKETKPASDFYKNKHMSDGLYTHCKSCYTEAANQRSAGRAPAETKRCRRCGSVKEASDFYISKMTADGLQSYCKACYAVASAARRSRSHHDQSLHDQDALQDAQRKEMDEYAAQQHMQEQLLQGQYPDVHSQVMGVPHLGLHHHAQLQQLGYDPSLMQGELEDPDGLGHEGLTHQGLDHQVFDHQAHHMLDPSLGHQDHSGLDGMHHGLDPHHAMDHQVLDHHSLGHHTGADHDDVYGHLDANGTGLLHHHDLAHLQMVQTHAQYEKSMGQ